MSPFCIPAPAAGLPATTFSTCTLPAGSCTPCVRRYEVMPTATIKFITTPAIKIAARSFLLRAQKYSFFAVPFATCPSSSSSPANFTNPPMGSAFTEYTVPPTFFPQIRGGKPKPNSSTATPNSRATLKCPNSWAKTRRVRIMRNTKAVRIILYLKQFLLFALSHSVYFGDHFVGQFLHHFFSVFFLVFVDRVVFFRLFQFPHGVSPDLAHHHTAAF